MCVCVNAFTCRSYRTKVFFLKFFSLFGRRVVLAFFLSFCGGKFLHLFFFFFVFFSVQKLRDFHNDCFVRCLRRPNTSRMSFLRTNFCFSTFSLPSHSNQVWPEVLPWACEKFDFGQNEEGWVQGECFANRLTYAINVLLSSYKYERVLPTVCLDFEL